VLEQRPAAATQVARAGRIVLVVGKAKAKAKPRPVVTPTVIVTSVVGLSREVATQALLGEGLGVRVYGVRSPRQPGTVIAQSPASGSRADAGSYVRINVAEG
jgi:beta-lactam-binding protein with PASTA domain